MPVAPPKPDLRPLYAMAGLTDLVASTVRERVEHNRVETARRWAELKQKVPTLPQVTIQRLISLPGQATSYLAEAETRYGQLADRGKVAVGNLPVPPWAERFVPKAPTAPQPATTETTATTATADTTDATDAADAADTTAGSDSTDAADSTVGSDTGTE